MRISQANEDSQRPANHQPPPPNQTQAPRSLRFTKKSRLRKPGDYQHLARIGRRFGGKSVSLTTAPSENNWPRLGITVTRKFGPAPVRNRFKRLCREAFRTLAPTLSQDFHITPKKEAPLPTLASIQEDLIDAEQSAKKSR